MLVCESDAVRETLFITALNCSSSVLRQVKSSITSSFILNQIPIASQLSLSNITAQRVQTMEAQNYMGNAFKSFLLHRACHFIHIL